jgi:hypothetical protein
MKFTQSDAAKKIRTSLTKGGKTCFLSERTISEQLETLMKLLVTDETELEDFVTQVEPIFKTANGGAQNDQSEFVRRWNEEHPLPEPPKNEPKPKADPKENTELTELRKQVQELIEAQTQVNKAKALNEKKNELIAKLTEKGVKDKEWIDSFVGEISITEDLDVEKKADDYLKLYNKSVSVGTNPATPGSPSGGNKDDKVPDAITQAIAMAKRDRSTGI